MILILYALLALAILYLTARFSRFRRFAEVILSVGAAAGLIAAFAIWSAEGGSPNTPQQTNAPSSTISAAEIALNGLTFARSEPETSYRLTGTVTNKSEVPLDYFRLTATLENCVSGACSRVGADTALIVARLLPGKSMALDTFFTIPNPDQIVLTQPKWTTEIGDIRVHVQNQP